MVMPRSFSRSMESRTCPTAFLASMVPVTDRSRSASVDLPWSMWATMEKLRISAVLIWLRIPCHHARRSRRAPTCDEVAGPGETGPRPAREFGHPLARSRPESSVQARAVRHDAVRFDHGAGPDVCARSHARAGADDAVADHGAGADRHAVPED